jgi:hypothetical protein
MLLQGVHTMLLTAILSTLEFITITTSCLSDTFKTTGTIDTYFSPREGATEAIVKEINSAKLKTLVQAYFFTSKPIAIALVDDYRWPYPFEAFCSGVNLTLNENGFLQCYMCLKDISCQQNPTGYNGCGCLKQTPDGIFLLYLGEIYKTSILKTPEQG